MTYKRKKRDVRLRDIRLMTVDEKLFVLSLTSYSLKSFFMAAISGYTLYLFGKKAKKDIASIRAAGAEIYRRCRKRLINERYD